jgi:hypothetical protein
MDVVGNVSETAKVAQPAAAQEVPNRDDGAFKFALKRLGDDEAQARIQRLVADITAQGEKINKHMDVRDLRVYRSLIAEFINEVTTKAYRFSRENYLNKRGLHKVYSIVKIINHDLDDLAQELIKQEKDHIAILSKTGEIAGLLLDLLA